MECCSSASTLWSPCHHQPFTELPLLGRGGHDTMLKIEEDGLCSIKLVTFCQSIARHFEEQANTQ